MSVLKSIGAVLGGFLVVVILSIATDYALEASGIFTPPSAGFFTTWMLMVALIYRCIFTVAGGFVTAVLAPKNKMKHVIVLGIIGIVAGSVGVVVGWNLSAHWYPIALVVTAFPCTWWGGRLRIKRQIKGV